VLGGTIQIVRGRRESIGGAVLAATIVLGAGDVVSALFNDARINVLLTTDP
jgi:hypothetical protein